MSRYDYRLPEYLGGVECTLLSSHGDGRVTVVLPGKAGLTIELPLSDLVELLPEEPADGSIVEIISQQFGDAYLGYRQIWTRSDALGGWFTFSENSKRQEPASWRSLCATGPVIGLVPDPADGAPDLPWEYKDPDGIPFTVTLDVPPNAVPYIRFANDCPIYHMPLEYAEVLAAALLRAAREARAAT